MDFPEKLTLLRKEKGVSLQAVADAVGMSKSHIHDMEKGKSDNPSMQALKNLALYFNVTVDYLVGLNEIDRTFINEYQFIDIVSTIQNKVIDATGKEFSESEFNHLKSNLSMSFNYAHIYIK